MKDLVITGKSLKREIWVILSCFVVACCVNLFAILKYDRPAVELVSQIGFVIAIAVVIYLLLWIVRLLALLIRAVFCKKK